MMKKNIKYFFLILLAVAVTFIGCKKVQDCTPGAKQYSDNPTGIQKSSKSDPCELERIAVQEADSLLNQVYGPDVRTALDSALYVPDDISAFYWSGYNNGYVPQGTLLDSAKRHVVMVEGLWEISNPFPVNDENLRKLHAKCGIYVAGAEDLQAKQGALEDCENGVGTGELDPAYICDENGFWVDFLKWRNR